MAPIGVVGLHRLHGHLAQGQAPRPGPQRPGPAQAQAARLRSAFFKKIALSRFSRNLGTMMKSGVPILQALEIVSSTTGNVVLERAIKDVQESVRSGESLAKPLEQHSVFRRWW